jgi:flavin-binding protein dodecin
MTQKLVTEIPEKTQQHVEGRETSPDSAQSFQGGLHAIAQLQRTLGNQRVAQLIQAKRLTPEGKIIGLQRKLTVGAADDQYEQEADRVALQVINTPDAVVTASTGRAPSLAEAQNQTLQTKPLAASITPIVQRQRGKENEEDQDREQDEEEAEPIQAKPAGSMADSFDAGANVEMQLSQSKGRGSPLPEPVRAFMEPRFGVDFSHVHVHTGSDALQMNQAVGAQAFTHGSDIYFGEGRSPTNLELTAHELTHVVQQTGGAPLQTKKLNEVPSANRDPSIQRTSTACAGDSGIVIMPRERVVSARADVAGFCSALQRQPNGPATVDVHDLPFADKDQEQIRKSARDSLPVWADTFANLWYTANNGALGAIAEPEDPDFKSDAGHLAIAAFGTSLAGNLLWAAVCLVPPARVGFIAAMSFGGAAIGSGAFGVMAGQPTSSQPSFKIPVASALARARDSIAGVAKNQVKDVADNCAVENVTDIEEQKKKLWAKVFNTTYNQAEPIVSAATANLTGAATSFVAQWQIHKKSPEVAKEAWRRTDERIKRDGYPWSVRLQVLWEPAGPGGPADVYKLKVFNEENLKYAVESFKPTFKF